jgi:hypothetical protein
MAVFDETPNALVSKGNITNGIGMFKLVWSDSEFCDCVAVREFCSMQILWMGSVITSCGLGTREPKRMRCANGIIEWILCGKSTWFT